MFHEAIKKVARFLWTRCISQAFPLMQSTTKVKNKQLIATHGTKEYLFCEQQ